MKITRIQHLKEFFLENKYIVIIMMLLFLERVYAGYILGITYSLASDDASYIASGIEFIKTGHITMHGTISAQIMPGMPVLIGVVSFFTGEGRLFRFALKFLWYIMGSLSAFFIYKSILLFTPKVIAVIGVLPLFLANYVWMDNLILTETPFMLCFCIMIYATLMMGRSSKKFYFWLCALAYMLALMFKANIAPYPIFAMIYLLSVKYELKLILKQGLILSMMVLCFIIPWSIRNYKLYDAFVPLTWGSGNPMLLGTYQGRGYPADEEMDYVNNVDKVMRQKYAHYYDESGNPRRDYWTKYLALESDGVKARYRMKEWFNTNPGYMIESYLILKPRYMINSVFYWETVFDVAADNLVIFKKINWYFCLLALFLSFNLKKYRQEILFFSALYMGNIYIYSLTFSFSRYSETLMPIRYIMVGVGILLLVQWRIKLVEEIRNRYF